MARVCRAAGIQRRGDREPFSRRPKNTTSAKPRAKMWQRNSRTPPSAPTPSVQRSSSSRSTRMAIMHNSTATPDRKFT